MNSSKIEDLKKSRYWSFSVILVFLNLTASFLFAPSGGWYGKVYSLVFFAAITVQAFEWEGKSKRFVFHVIGVLTMLSLSVFLQGFTGKIVSFCLVAAYALWVLRLDRKDSSSGGPTDATARANIDFDDYIRRGSFDFVCDNIIFNVLRNDARLKLRVETLTDDSLKESIRGSVSRFNSFSYEALIKRDSTNYFEFLERTKFGVLMPEWIGPLDDMTEGLIEAYRKELLGKRGVAAADMEISELLMQKPSSFQTVDFSEPVESRSVNPIDITSRSGIEGMALALTDVVKQDPEISKRFHGLTPAAMQEIIKNSISKFADFCESSGRHKTMVNYVNFLRYSDFSVLFTDFRISDSIKEALIQRLMALHNQN